LEVRFSLLRKSMRRAVLLSELDVNVHPLKAEFPKLSERQKPTIMFARVTRLLPALCVAVVVTAAGQPAAAQNSPDPAAAEKAKQQSGDAKKDAPQRKTDDLMELSRQIAGPAGNPECVWLGRRVVNLLWRDDMDTAFRHLDLYDRFGCPGGHIQATFRCVVRQGAIDPKAPDSLQGRVNTCWVNPSAPPAPAAAATTPQAGTTTQ
jgi:hypothetical protein